VVEAIRRGHRRDLLLVALAGALLYLPALGARDLWNPDEARYAQVAREMRERGDWLVPHLNGAVYGEKPPLFFWLIGAAAVPLSGVDETAARLPSALAAIGTLLLTFAMAQRLFGRRAAWLAAAALGTCAAVLWQARFGQIDMVLTLLVTLSLWCWLTGWLTSGGAGRPGLYRLFFAVTGVATVAKGPGGMLPPLLGVVAFLAVTRRWGDLRELHIGRGLLLWALVVLAWLVPAGLAGGESYWRGLVLEQNFTRYTDPWHHLKPWYYYLTVLPALYFPWALLLPGALVAGWRGLVRPHGVAAERTGAAAAPNETSAARADPRLAADGFLFALAWVAATLVFFSLSPAKRGVYLLTMFPGLALLVGAGLDRAAAALRADAAAGGPHRPSPTSLLRLHRAWLALPAALVAAIGLGGAAALAVAGPDRPETAVIGPGFVWTLAAAAAAMGLGGAVAAAWFWRRRPAVAAAALAAGMAVLGLTLALRLLPAFDVFKSARPLAERLLAESAPGEPWAVLPHLDPAFLYYIGRPGVPAGDEAALRAFLGRPGRLWLLAERDDVARLALDPAALGLAEVTRDNDPVEGYVLYRRPAAAVARGDIIDP
jgi:4-amino-4-deoxy-L-arabinose transferase-like glycosyltransferase